MKELTVAKVAVENTAYSFDMLFEYSVPDFLCSEILPGMRVLVPFGTSSKKRVGIVFAVNKADNSEKKLKKIDSILDDEPLLSFEMLKTANFIHERCFCTYFEACKMFLPLGLSVTVNIQYAINVDFKGEITDKNENAVFEYLQSKNCFVSSENISKACSLTKIDVILDSMVSKGILIKNIDAQRKTGDATIKMVRLKVDSNDALTDYGKITAKQKEVIKVLTDIGIASVKELCYFTGFTPAVVTALENKGIVETFENEIYRIPFDDSYEPVADEILLSDEQNKAFGELLKLYNDEKPKGALLYGVTGSGKTQVYLKLIDEAIKSEKGIIVMIPEISLTPQLLSVFYERYGSKIAVLHSALSLGQRLDEWKRIKRGEAQIVVGTRSAVFAPFKEIGLIIIDEEQESTYKSEMTPRYHARDIAAYRIGCHNGLMLLASATPSVDTYTKALNGSYSLLTLNERYGNAVLPAVETIDTMYQSDMVLENISKKLADEIKSTINNGKQCILLLNRRGYNTYVSCTECGTVATCPNCSISMTYHIKNGRLMCHYCGYSAPYTTECSNCNNDTLRFVGAGTQKLEEELKLIVPEARILRMDTDTTNSRYSYEEMLREFGKGNYDILVGTQMVAKGLNFEDVTLVGVLSVDRMLYNDDYKSGERAFDLITQVVGRSGRGNNPGKAYIQTAYADSEIICFAKEQDYKSFYDVEINMRRQMVYPPFCDLCVIGFSSEKEYALNTFSANFLDALKKLHSECYNDLKIIVLGPVSPRISKVGGKFRSRIIIKCRNEKRFREMISRLLKESAKNNKNNNVSVYVDINPENIL